MKSIDLQKQENQEIMQKLTEAMQAGEPEAMQAAVEEFCTGIEQRILEEAAIVGQNADREVLAARGVRQLTGEEKKFYQKWIEAAGSGSPKQALGSMDAAMPFTIIDSVLEEMRQAHPLLAAIDFSNANGLIKMILNAGDTELATWDKLNTQIKTELAGSIETVDLLQAKLTAFLPVPKDLLRSAFGPEWLDNYVRIVLEEASAFGLETAILKGTGKDQPIGMCKDLAGSVVSGVYADKTKVPLKTLAPEEYCGVIAPLSKKPIRGYRPVPEVLLVVNPMDYITKVVPSTTVRAADGTYKNNIFPYPTRVIQSAALLEGEAVLGLAKRYYMGIGAGSSGTIEYSDEYQFLEDTRVYLTRMYGMGRPKDNNAFVYLDISKLKPAPLKVQTVTDTPAAPAS